MSVSAGQGETPGPGGEPTLYEALSVPRDAGDDAINSAYVRALSAIEGQEGAEAEVARRRISEARRVLTDRRLRSDYDYLLRMRESRADVRRRHVPIVDTLREAWQLVRQHPRTTLLPMIVVQTPVALVVAIITALLYLSAFQDEEVLAAGEVVTLDRSWHAFTLLALTGVQALFAQVGYGATIVAVGGLIQGKPMSLVESLDPAFSRMGALLAVAAVVVVLPMIFLVLGFVVPGLFFALLVAVYLVLRTSVTGQALLLEGLGPWAAIRRSWVMLKGNLVRLFCVTFLGLIIPATLVSIPVALLDFVPDGSDAGQVFLRTAISFGQTVLTAPVFAFTFVVVTAFYFRVRALHDARPAH